MTNLVEAEKSPLVDVADLRKEFRRGSKRRGTSVVAVDNVSFEIAPGEAVGLVGESGSGKSTTARCLVGLDVPTAGSARVGGVDVGRASRAERSRLRSQVQYVFQDPYDSLSPRWRVRDIVAEPLIAKGKLSPEERDERVREALRLVHLDETFLFRYPHEMSGGQRQRVGIARALVANPSFIVLDEPTSSLDYATRSEVLELLADLRARLSATYLFISHDLAAVRELCDRILVMYLGQIVESGPTEEIFANPRHPYTRSLLSAVLSVEPGLPGKRRRLRGELSSGAATASGCPLAPRCPVSVDSCRSTPQELLPIGPRGHTVACMRVTDPTDRIAWADES